jgi:hypothetical protein
LPYYSLWFLAFLSNWSFVKLSSTFWSYWYPAMILFVLMILFVKRASVFSEFLKGLFSFIYIVFLLAYYTSFCFYFRCSYSSTYIWCLSLAIISSFSKVSLSISFCILPIWCFSLMPFWKLSLTSLTWCCLWVLSWYSLMWNSCKSFSTMSLPCCSVTSCSFYFLTFLWAAYISYAFFNSIYWFLRFNYFSRSS